MACSKKPVANPAIVLREEFDDWGILFNPDTAAVVAINPVCVAIWKLINGQNCVNEIVDEIQDCYSNVPLAAHDEILEFIDQLAKDSYVGYEL